MRTGTVVAAAGFFGAAVAAPSAVAGPADAESTSAKHGWPRPPKPLLGFKAVAAKHGRRHHRARGLHRRGAHPLGHPDPLRRPGVAEGRLQHRRRAGPADRHAPRRHALLPRRTASAAAGAACSCSTTSTSTHVLLYPDGDAVMTQEKVDKALAAHGVSVVAIEKRHSRQWRLVDSRYNRRITGTTPVTFSGPVPACHPTLAANGPAMGTLNNCSNGVHPVGHLPRLRGELERLLRHRATRPGRRPPSRPATASTAVGVGYRWHLLDPRFDIAVNPNEAQPVRLGRRDRPARPALARR